MGFFKFSRGGVNFGEKKIVVFSPEEPKLDIKRLKKIVRKRSTKLSFYQKVKSLLRWRWSFKGWRHKKGCSCSDCCWSTILKNTEYDKRDVLVCNNGVKQGTYTTQLLNIVKQVILYNQSSEPENEEG